MCTTAHSEFGRLTSLLLKKASDAFISESQIREQWAPLNFLSKPDLSKAMVEYEQFESILKAHCDNICYLPEDRKTTMDSIYCRDAAISTDHGMIICSMGKAAREPEPLAQKLAFEQTGVAILGQIRPPGTLEGGDVAWIDEYTLAVGHTYRSNVEGIRQLRILLGSFGASLLVAELPHYKGPTDVFHLMSLFSPVDKDLAVVYSSLMPIAFRNELLARDFRLIEVPEEEFDSLGCNVLALAPRLCLMAKGNSKTKRLLEGAGCQVIEYEGAEISLKGGGGPTCLTRPISRFL
jgi:N-dimethylarginine dimethylaminohydrolase